MDSVDSLLAIQLPLSDSESSSSTSTSTTSNNEDAEMDTEDNVNNEDDQVDAASDDDDANEAVIYADDVLNSTDSSSCYNTIPDSVVATAPQTATQLPIALSYTTPLPLPPPSSAKTSSFVPPSSAAAAAASAAAKSPPTPVIVTATPLPSLGPLQPQSEYEPAASVGATRLSAQHTDSLRRRAESLTQKRLRMQVRAFFTRVQKLLHYFKLTAFICTTLLSH